MQDAQSLGDNDDQPPRADDANAALLAWYRHLATSDEITHARLERNGLEADLPAQGLPEPMPQSELVWLDHDAVPAIVAVQPSALAEPDQHGQARLH